MAKLREKRKVSSVGRRQQENGQSNNEQDSDHGSELVNPFKSKSFNKTLEDAKKLKIPKMLFSEFIFETDLTIIFSSANVGKTMLAVQIADSISRGTSINGFVNESKAQPVIYLDFELSEKQFEGRYSEKDINKENWFNHYDFSDNIHRVVFNRKFKNPLTVESIVEGVKIETENHKSKIVFIDNISWIISTGLEHSKDAGRLMKKLIDLKSDKNLTLIILAHTPKKYKWSPVTLIDLAGSAQLGNFADSVFAINYSKEDNSHRYIKQVKCRFTELKYHSSNVIPVRLTHIQPNFIGIEILEKDNENILETNHIQRKKELETVVYTKEEKERLYKLVLNYVRQDPEVSYRQLADELDIGKDMAGRLKERAEIELSSNDRQTDKKK